jgi:hypothetical protein
MKERPILFNAESVRGILEGRKTQTRRVIKPQPKAELGELEFCFGKWHFNYEKQRWDEGDDMRPGMWIDGEILVNLYGVPGDQLWVRETWQSCPHCSAINYRASSKEPACRDCDNPLGNWKPSIHMFREYSRIQLEVVGVRVERVHSISEEDCFAEGITEEQAAEQWWDGPQPVAAFADLWDSINEKRGFGWDTNPWVWVVEFRVLEGER